MGRPRITADQREMAVVMLANALRKDAHLHAPAPPAAEPGGALYHGLTKRRSEPARRYVEGMRDLLRVLFPDGHAVADECLEEAYARAIGASAPVAKSDNGTRYH